MKKAFSHALTMKKDGYVVTCPTVSPENTYILSDGISGRVCAGATMDNEILRDLFSDYLEARIELKMDMEEEKRHDFGNARGIRNVFERIVTHKANRLVSLGEPSLEQLKTILPEDVWELD